MPNSERQLDPTRKQSPTWIPTNSFVSGSHTLLLLPPPELLEPPWAPLLLLLEEASPLELPVPESRGGLAEPLEPLELVGR